MFNKIDYIVDYEKELITLTEEGSKKALSNLRKITGSNFYDILEIQKYIENGEGSFKFAIPISSILSRVGLKIPIFDTISVDAGNTYEDIIHNELVKKLEENNINFKIKQVKSKEVNYDYFPEVNSFGGVPDALLEIDGRKIVIDYKTAKRSKWNDTELGKGGYEPNTKQNYIYQLELYKKLLDYDEMWIVYTLLDFEDYFEDTMSMNKEIVISKLANTAFPNSQHASLDIAMADATNFIEKFAKGECSIPFNTKMNMNDLIWLGAHNQEERDEIERRIIFKSSYDKELNSSGKLK